MKSLRYYYWRMMRCAIQVIKFIYVNLRRPWIEARFYAAWVEYQCGPVYRERLVGYGLGQTIYGFLRSHWEQRYCLKLRCRRERWLRWKILFMPFSFTIPEELAIASREGYFEPEAKKRLNII